MQNQKAEVICLMQYVFYVTAQGQFAVTTEMFWREHQAISDVFDAGLNSKMKELGFYETRRNIYERPPLESVETAKELLIRNGFKSAENFFN